MKWLSQVVHVAAKDARMTRWLAAGYVVLVLGAALQLGGGVLPALWSALALLIALLAVAQVVQDDPAIRDDAFWVSRPLSPGAVFTAKSLTLLAAAAIALVGQAVLLARYRIAAPELLRALPGDAVMWVAVVAAAVAMAALTRDLRGFVLALMGLLACFAAAGALLEDQLKGLLTVPDGAAPLLAIAGAVLTAGYQYGSGRRGRAAGLVVVLLAACTVLGWAPGPRGEPSRAAETPVLPLALRPDSIVVHAGEAGQGVAGNLGFRLAGGSPGLEYVLTEAALKLRARDGSEVVAPLRRRTQLSAGTVALPGLAGVRWAGLPREADWTGVDLALELARAATRQSGSDVAGGPLVLESVSGKVEGWAARIGARLPLRVGESITRSGRRLRVRALAEDTTGIHVEVEVSRLDDTRSIGFFSGAGPLRYAILDRTRRIAFPLEIRSSGGGNGGTFLLPQPAATFTYRLERARTPAEPPAPPLTDSLELLVFDWRAVGSYPVSIPVEPRAAGVPGPSTAAPSAKKLEPLLRGER